MSASALWRGEPLVLASGSAARAAMLRALAIPITVAPSTVDEAALIAKTPGDPRALATLLARAKAQDVSARFPGRLVLGADQTLSLDGRLFQKPADRAAALAQLRALAGATHELVSAACLMRDGRILAEPVASARLTMRPYDSSFEACLEADPAALASVGCYRIESVGARLFSRIEGDHWTIMGLPVLEVMAALRETGSLP